jgi:magnesium-transporting ATPase (P-type)
MDWHKTATDDVLKQLDTSLERGLTHREAEQRLQKYGANELVDPVEDLARAVHVGDGADPDRGGGHFIAGR